MYSMHSAWPSIKYQGRLKRLNTNHWKRIPNLYLVSSNEKSFKNCPHKMDEGGITQAQLLHFWIQVSHRTWKTSFLLCPDQTETERKRFLKRWKWSGVEHWHRKASITGKGKAALPCDVITTTPAVQLLLYVCVKHRKRQRDSACLCVCVQGWETVAGCCWAVLTPVSKISSWPTQAVTL